MKQLIFILKKSVAFILFLVIVLILWGVFYYQLVYIEKEITFGEGFGFEIGDHKSEVYRGLYSNVIKEGDGYTDLYFSLKVSGEIEHVVGVSRGANILVESLFDPDHENVFQGRDVWKIYIDGNRSNSISLTFCEDKLCEIYRHRRWFNFTI